tara:strand:- start:354 stop:554 length:201 start_codon:yes stop_codon:yes gene_type:complete
MVRDSILKENMRHPGEMYVLKEKDQMTPPASNNNLDYQKTKEAHEKHYTSRSGIFGFYGGNVLPKF